MANISSFQRYYIRSQDSVLLQYQLLMHLRYRDLLLQKIFLQYSNKIDCTDVTKENTVSSGSIFPIFTMLNIKSL